MTQDAPLNHFKQKARFWRNCVLTKEAGEETYIDISD